MVKRTKNMSQISLSPFWFASPEMIGVKVCNRQTDKFFDTYKGVFGFFISVKFATSLLALLARG